MPSNSPPSLSDLLAEVFRRGGMKRGVRRAEAVLLWPQVVGADVAKFTTAKSLQDGVLFVEVSDSETGMHLTWQRQRFLAVYRSKFGVKDVRDILFRVGRPVTPEPPPPPPVHAPVDPKALSKLARDLGTLDLPEALSGPAMSVAKAMLAYRARREAEGWTPCLVCGTLTPDAGPCDTCTRYAAEPRVRRSSHLLALNPAQDTPLLSDEEREVAVHLARAYLLEKLQELLPQVLADPAFKPHLESAARCYLAHILSKNIENVTDEDFDRLDPRVARALGRWR